MRVTPHRPSMRAEHTGARRRTAHRAGRRARPAARRRGGPAATPPRPAPSVAGAPGCGPSSATRVPPTFTVQLTDEVPRIPVPAAAARRFASLVRDADLAGFAVADRVLLAVGARVAPLVPRLVMPLVLPAAACGVGRCHPARRRPTARRPPGASARRGCAVQRQRARRGDPRRRRGAAPARQVLDRLRRRRRRLRLGQDLGRLRRHQRARVRSDRRPGRRAVARALSHGGVVRPTEVRQPRHGGVPRPRPDARRVPDGARRTRVSSTSTPASCCRRTCPTRTDGGPRAGGSGRWRRHRRAGGQREGPAREGGQPGDGVGRRRAARLGDRPRTTARPTSTPTTRRCSTCCSTPRSTRRSRIGVGQPQPVRRRLGARPARRAASPPADPIASRSRCSRAWRRRSRPPCATPPATCCCTRPIVSSRRLPGGDRLPRATARREHLARQLPLAPVRPRRPTGACSTRRPTASPRRSAPGDSVPAERRRTQVRVERGRRRPGRPGHPVRQRARHRLDAPDEPGLDRARRWRAERPPAAPADAARRPSPTSTPPSTARSTRVDPRGHAIDADRRAELLDRVGDVFEANRGRILATMVAEAGKTVAEGDPEVSEAVDFARYYAACALRARRRARGGRQRRSGRWSSRRRGTSRSRSRPAACSPRSRPATP